MKNNFGYLLGEGFKSTFKHGFMSFAAVCITVACLVIINSFLLICYNLNLIVEDLQKKTRIVVIVDETLLTHEAQSIGSEINLLENVANAKFVSREEALAEFGNSLGESADLLIGAESDYDQYVVTVADETMLASTISDIERLSGVVAVLDQVGEDVTAILVIAQKVKAPEQVQSYNEIGMQIEQMENIANVLPVSGEEAFERFGNLFENGDSLFAGIGASTMRDQFELTLVDNGLIEQTKAEIESIPGVARVEANVREANAMVNLRTVLYIASVAIMGVLLIVSLIIISNTIKLAMMDRREEIAIMKMVGATNSFIRLPFLIEGFILGLFGAVFSFFIEWGLYEVLRKAIEDAGFAALKLLPFADIWMPMAAICAVAGFVIGIFGSLMSIRRFLKV